VALRRLIIALGVVAGAYSSVSCLRVTPPVRQYLDALPQRPASNRPASADEAAPHVAVLQKYCSTCHSERLRTAGLAFEPALLDHLGDHSEIWEKVAMKLRAGAMPPAGAPRPDQATVNSLANWIEGELDAAARTRTDPGRTAAFHRLNRAEYRNAIRDLLALDVDVAADLPADDIDEQGFDNMADVLSVSPVLFERYLSAARRTARLAVGRLPLSPSAAAYRLPLLLTQDDRMSEELPFGSRGGAAARHYFPVDGEYEVTLRLQRNYVNYIRGLGTRQELDVRLDGVLLKRFVIGGENRGRPAPASYAGNIFGDPAWENHALYADSDLKLRVAATAGTHVLGVSFVRNLTAEEGVLQPKQSVFAVAINDMRDGNAAVEEVTVTGPYQAAGAAGTPSRRRIFVCQPERESDERVCARRILTTLARRAYRRPVAGSDVETLLHFYELGRAEGTFDSGIQAALERLLIAPDFLFRMERDPAGAAPGAAFEVSDFELASRLSFFLWSSIPDDELLDLAERGELGKTVVRAAQVRRMLADPRSRALVENFAGQWLYLRNLAGVVPDPIAFPEFDENLRDAFRRETEMFVGSQIREDRSLSDVISADYTFANERLARHYGIPHVYGSHFRRVKLEASQAAVRGGILGHGSLLTVTSYPNRTSPVLRGKWVLANVLGTPPPAPPPDVPDLPDTGEGGRPATVRERLEEHRRNPTCAACHAPMDPLGLALENYDAVGTWRKDETAMPIDASGALPDGTRFEGLAGLRGVVMARREQFVRTVTEKLMAYGLGRSIAHTDRSTIRQIVRDAASRDYRWSAIVLGIVESTPFRMRRSAS
jgi:mono/diheme cytochrome c family protein